MTTEQQQLHEARQAFAGLSLVWSERLETLRKAAAVDCNHPPELVQPYHWEFDNGYGRQRRTVGSRCTVCQHIDHYNDGRWLAPEDCTYD